MLLNKSWQGGVILSPIMMLRTDILIRYWNHTYKLQHLHRSGGSLSVVIKKKILSEPLTSDWKILLPALPPATHTGPQSGKLQLVSSNYYLILKYRWDWTNCEPHAFSPFVRSTSGVPPGVEDQWVEGPPSCSWGPRKQWQLALTQEPKPGQTPVRKTLSGLKTYWSRRETTGFPWL